MRIESVQVHAQGPLRKNLEMNPKGLNLIYGKNETGKTYLLEAFSSWLFGTGRKSPLTGVARNWVPAPSGSITIGEFPSLDGKVSRSFGPSSKLTLQDSLEKELKLPTVLSKLLLVRAGDSLLNSPEILIRQSLSSSGVLEGIINDKHIKRNLHKANLGNGVIHANNAGEIKDRNLLAQKMEKLRELRRRFAEEREGEVDGLEQEIIDIEEKIKKLKLAKNHQAFETSRQIKHLKNQMEEHPEDLEELDSKLDLIEKIKADLQEKNLRVQYLEDELNHKDWSEHALVRYRELEVMQNAPIEPVSRSNPVFLICFLASLISTVALSLFSSIWAGTASGLVAVVFLLLWLLVKTEQEVEPRSENPDLTRIKNEFKLKFGEELVSEEAFQEKVAALNRLQGQKEEAVQQVHHLREQEIDLQARLETRLGASEDSNSSIPKWKEQISLHKTQLADLLESQQSKERELDRLQVPEEDYLQEGPEIVWDQKLASELEMRLRAEVERQHQSQIELGQLKTEVAAVTEVLSGDWEELIGSLEEKIVETEIEYKEITAEIIAKICVVSTVRELQEEEDELIAENLKNPEFTSDIQQISGNRFSGFTWDKGNLKLAQSGTESLSQEFLSTGAKEQVMIALRLLFSRHYLDGEPGFLLLDDAFQNSDWDRRANMVDHLVELVRSSGWQILYFTMDDHLRDLFRSKANILAEDFQYYELGTDAV
jgi:recombinational DNA repair ATPase RecF